MIASDIVEAFERIAVKLNSQGDQDKMKRFEFPASPYAVRIFFLRKIPSFEILQKEFDG